MYKFQRYPKCPKCQYESVDMQHHEKTMYSKDPIKRAAGMTDYKEWLSIKCKRCDFSWTMFTAKYREDEDGE